MRQANTTFVNLRAALDDLDPLVEHGEAGDQEPGAVPGRTAPGAARNSSRSRATCASPSPGPARPTTSPNCWPRCRRCSSGPRSAFPHAEDAIAAFQPNLNFARAYTPDLFNALGKLGAGRRLLRRQRPLRARVATRPRTSSPTKAARLKPITKAEQFDAFGSSAPVRRRCPGGATQTAADGSNPFVNPPLGGSSVSSSECNPADAPPGP